MLARVCKITIKSEKIESWVISAIEQSGSPFYPNIKYSKYIDFNLFDTLDLYKKFLLYYNFVEGAEDNNVFNLAGYPLISEFFNNFKLLPKLQKYINSELYKLPFTNKGAKFGSGKSGITWDPAIDTDTTPEEIIIK